MGVLILLLVLTNLTTLGVVGWLLLRPAPDAEPDAVVAASLDAAPHPAGASGKPRRIISIEILNALELAGSRSRVANIARSFVPGLTRRIVHEQALKQIRRDIREQGVVADVRLHVIRPVEPVIASVPPSPLAESQPPEVHPVPQAPVYFDEIQQLKFEDVEERGA